MVDRRGAGEQHRTWPALEGSRHAVNIFLACSAHASSYRTAMRIYPPSLFDRLFGNAASLPVIRLLDLDELKESVARDLEILLNTRRVPDFDDESVSEPLRRSVLGFGLVDFSSMSLSSVHDRLSICTGLKRAIEVHEPRLKDVDVTLDAGRREHKQLAFSIKARLETRPVSELVSFDAFLQPATLQYSVHGQNSRPQTA